MISDKISISFKTAIQIQLCLSNGKRGQQSSSMRPESDTLIGANAKCLQYKEKEQEKDEPKSTFETLQKDPK